MVCFTVLPYLPERSQTFLDVSGGQKVGVITGVTRTSNTSNWRQSIVQVGSIIPSPKEGFPYAAVDEQKACSRHAVIRVSRKIKSVICLSVRNAPKGKKLGVRK